MSTSEAKEEHRAFLNGYYGISRHFYDLTRKYYLFGRDRELWQLLQEEWDSLVEIGPGTGRNLRLLHRSRPYSRYGGVDACDEMRFAAQKTCPFATFRPGFAEDANIESVLGTRPDRILFSYCLSMVQQPRAALENALAALPPHGEIALVDFCDFAKLPEVAGQGLLKWLRSFHVEPLGPELLAPFGAEISYGPGRYYLRARICKDGAATAGSGGTAVSGTAVGGTAVSCAVPCSDG